MKLLIHAATAEELDRARRHAFELHRSNEEVGIAIVASDQSVRKAIEDPDPATDPWLVVCAGALQEEGLVCPFRVSSTPTAAYFIVKMQGKGWAYLRA